MAALVNEHCAAIIAAFVASPRGRELAERAAPPTKLTDEQWSQMLDQCGASIAATLEREYPQ